VKLRKW